MTLTQLATKLKGGPGSGDHGHSGRPGKRGGSSGGKGGGSFANVGSDQGLIDHYNLEENCGTTINCFSIRDYTDEGYEDVNIALREESFGGVSRNPTEVKEIIANLDDAMNWSPGTPNDMIAYRGVDSTGQVANLKAGDTFTDKGFVSTSIAKASAEDWAGLGGSIVEMRIPKGSKGLYVKSESKHPKENEFLLPRSSSFNIVSTTTHPVTKQPYIVAELTQ